MVGAIVWFGLWRRRLRREIGDPALIDRMTFDHSQTLQWIRVGLLAAGVSLLAVSLSQPRWGQTETTVERSGIDVVFALDLSKSMLARDVPPNRLEAATDEVKQTLTRLDGDRAGLVVFTAVSFVQSPLTTDYGAIRFYLDKLDPQQMSVGGTAIGRAIRDATELLIGHPLDQEEGDSKTSKMERADTQVIVLITDGEDHKTDPLAAAETAKQHGIRLVTMGVGGHEPAKIPVVNERGEVEGYKRDRRGNVVKTKLEAEQLRKMAEKTGGTYLEYRGNRPGVDRLVEYIDRLKKTKFEDELKKQYEDRFMYALVPAFLCLLLSFVIGERRSGLLGWSFESEERSAVDGRWFGLLVLLVALSPGCKELFRSPQPDVEEGNQLIAKEQYDKALEAYGRADASVGSSPSMHYNRGVVLLGQEKYEEARRHFARALEADAPEQQFDAHYNLGVTFSRQEKWEEALSSFEAALKRAVAHPETIDETWTKRTRHNLELAYRKLYPPCETFEDDREENDEPEAAPPLRGKKQARRGRRPSRKGQGRGSKKSNKKNPTEKLTLCGLDDDWYALEAMPGSTVTVEATFRQLREKPLPNHDFLPNVEDLEIALFGANGRSRLVRDQTGPPLEEDEPPTTKTEPPVTRTIEQFEVTRDMPLGSGRILLRVSAADQLEYEYDLNVEVEPPCRALQEKAESNDSRDQAVALEESGRKKLQMCPGDEDWFEVEAEMGDSIFVDVRPRVRKKKGGGAGSEKQPEPDDLELEMIDASTGESVGPARREGPFLTAGVEDVEEERTFYVKVTGRDDSHEGPYTLDLYAYAPCIVGDDALEENDQLSQASSFEGKSKIHRYLRLCPDDPDFYTVRSALPKSKSGGGRSQGGARAGTPGPPARGRPGSRSGSSGSTSKPTKARVGVGLSMVDPPETPSEAPISLDLLKRDGSILAEGRAPEADETSGDSSADDDAAPPSPPGPTTKRQPEGLPMHRMARTTLDLDGRQQGRGSRGRRGRRGARGPKVPVRVEGEPTFYHLVELTPQSGQKSKNHKRQSNNDQQKNNKRKQSNNQQKKQKNSPESQKKTPEQREKKKRNAQKKKKPEDARQTEDILKALEDTDKNFQMKKALEDKGERRIDKDW
jgi:Ca-activated chloride channel family protein